MVRPSVQTLVAQAAKEQRKELYLSGIDFTSLPSEIGNLTKLTSLHLSGSDGIFNNLCDDKLTPLSLKSENLQERKLT